MIDGTKDRNRVECISIGARYVRDGQIFETVVAMEACFDLTANGICDVVLKSLTQLKINLKLLLTQCYDGAAVMSGRTGGVQKILQERLGRRIPYVHCYNHRLHLVLINAIKHIDLVEIFFDLITMIYNFFQHYKVKNIYKGQSMKRLIETRWEGHQNLLK